jgi:CheY-like chemotaxis protein
MPSTPPEKSKTQEFFAKYVGTKKILVADASPTSRSSIANALCALGAKMPQIMLAQSYADAEAEIERNKPKIIICDYDLGKRCGLDLFQRLKAQNPDLRDCLFVLVTGNTSQSAVARAAEEDVDTFVLKPFTAEVLRNSILKAAAAKVRPPAYLVEIDKGKELIAAGKFDEAIAILEGARKLDPSPSLACFYLGQAQQMKKAQDGAKASYSEGLQHNKIHYKCMVGLFELLMSEKRFAEAYDVVKRIAHYFPANPQRMSSVLRLAIVTASYEDVERYYRIFTSMEQRDPEMVKYICAALVVCGKHYISTRNGSRALELFEKAAVTAAGSPRILREIILALLDAGLLKQAQPFLARFPAQTQSGADYLAMDLLMRYRTGPLGDVVSRGRDLVGRGIDDPVIYSTLIRASAEAGFVPAAEQLLVQASAKHPEKKAEFDQALKNAKTRPAPAKTGA